MIILTPLMLIALFSCSRNNDPLNKSVVFDAKLNQISITIDSLEPQRLKYSQLFSDYKVIPLETKKECLISRVTQLDIYNDQFYILDRKAVGFFVFNEKGDFIRRIGTEGKGAGQYLRPTCFSINKSKGELLCLDSKLKKIIIYSTNGECIKEIRLKGSHLYSDIVAKDDYIYLDVLLTEARPNTKSLVYTIDYNGDSIMEWTPKGEPITDLKFAGEYASPTLVANDDGFSLRRLYMNNIYRLNESQIQPYIRFKAEKCLSKVDIESIKGKKGYEIYSYLREKGKFRGVNQFFESDTFIFLSFRADESYYMLINKLNNDYVCFGPLREDLSGVRVGYFTTMYKDKMVTCANDRLMAQLMETDSLKIVGSHEISPISNPAIVMFKLKEDLPYNDN